MNNHQDVVGAIFFGVGAFLCACLTLWPHLWVVISVRPRSTAKQLQHGGKPLRVITAFGTLAGAVMAVGSYFGHL